ncbi:MAG: RING-HC finger protein [Nitrosopumilaceae archaeon]|nr:RING-HC finger protein [Nitrosopumilaceae archaeon]
MVFTDGFHNDSGDMNADATKDSIRRLADTHSICAYMGIGSSTNVDHATLTRLSEGQPGSYTNAVCATDVVNTIQARCFEMLTARDTRDVVIRLICKSDTVIPDSVVHGYLSQDEFEKLPELLPTTLATFDQVGDVCLITPSISSDVSHAAKGQELTLYIDTSGSMSTSVDGNVDHVQPLQSLQPKQADAAPVMPWVELSLPVSSWTSTSHLFFKAQLGRVSIEYTDIKDERHHECISVKKSDNMSGVVKLVDMMNWLNTRVMIREVRTYYKENMCILHDALGYPLWLRNQIKAVWNKVKERYRRVGPSTAAKTMQKGDAFFEAPPVTLLEMVRTATSTASTPTSYGTLGPDTESVEPQDDWDKCKICFNNHAELVFTGCGHAVVCMECYKEHLNKDGKPECIICRHAVEDYAMMNYSTGLNCKKCDQPGAYIGHCGHMHFCGTCVPKERRVVCEMCPSPTEVALVHVYV